MNAPGEEKLLAPEVLHHAEYRARPPVGLEEEPHRLLDLLVRI